VDDTPPQDDPQKNDPPTTRKRSDAVSEGSKTRDERLAELNKSKETSVQSKDKIDTESKEWKDFQARRDDFQEKMNTFKGRGEVIQGLQSIGQTIAQIGNTAGSYVGTMSQALAKDDEAEGSRDAAEAQTLQSQADYANTLMQKASDNLKQIISFLQTVQESKSDEMRSITKG